jgi:D-sedoheptulose 7-phosphate isomerase|tara:strand:+ start:8642 stop:9214 length:573 start_codon:yes stop_codon:yes gene_type:complete
MMSDSEIKKTFDESAKIILDSKKLEKSLINSISLITKALKNKKKIVIFGNGGSAADSQHMAGELIGRYLKERNSFSAIALTADSSILTALGNDFGFENIFSRQCEGLVRNGDIVIAISTSGNSKNVLNGILKSKHLGAKIISLTGNNTSKMKKYSDVIIPVSSNNTPRIQEAHRTIIHIICEQIEKNLSK